MFSQIPFPNYYNRIILTFNLFIKFYSQDFLNAKAGERQLEFALLYEITMDWNEKAPDLKCKHFGDLFDLIDNVDEFDWSDLSAQTRRLDNDQTGEALTAEFVFLPCPLPTKFEVVNTRKRRRYFLYYPYVNCSNKTPLNGVNSFKCSKGIL